MPSSPTGPPHFRFTFHRKNLEKWLSRKTPLCFFTDVLLLSSDFLLNSLLHTRLFGGLRECCCLHSGSFFFFYWAAIALSAFLFHAYYSLFWSAIEFSVDEFFFFRVGVYLCASCSSFSVTVQKTSSSTTQRSWPCSIYTYVCRWLSLLRLQDLFVLLRRQFPAWQGSQWLKFSLSVCVRVGATHTTCC